MELRETRDGRKLTVTCRGSGIEWNKIEVVEKLEVDEWMSIQVREDDIRYTCPDFDPLALRFDNPITEFDFFMIIAQIARTKSILDHLGLDEHDILWDSDYIYMSLNTRELKFIYLPTKRIDEENSVKTLITEIMYALTQTNLHDTYMTEFAFYLKRPGAYSSKSLIQYITEKESTIARLLRLNEQIQYSLPKQKEVEKEEDDEPYEIMDFFSDHSTDYKEEIIEVEPIVEPESKEEIGIGDFDFLKEDNQKSILLKVNDFLVEEIQDTNEDLVVEEMQEIDIYDFTSNPFPVEEETGPNMFATIRRISTGEEKVIDEDEFYLGKSKKITGFMITGNQTISRRHALISKRENEYFIFDLESVNHTFVNGKKVKLGKEIKLSDGDVIQLANEKFEFHIFRIES